MQQKLLKLNDLEELFADADHKWKIGAIGRRPGIRVEAQHRRPAVGKSEQQIAYDFGSGRI